MKIEQIRKSNCCNADVFNIKGSYLGECFTKCSRCKRSCDVHTIELVVKEQIEKLNISLNRPIDNLV